MEISERIKEVRKHLGLTLEKFGERIGLKKANLSMIENDKSTPTEQTILFICKEYKVNKDWLLYGKGDMFETSAQSEALNALKEEYNLDDFSMQLIEAYASLNSEQHQAVHEFIENLPNLNLTSSDEEAVTEEINKTTEELEAEYEKALGFASKTNSSALSTTDEKEA